MTRRITVLAALIVAVAAAWGIFLMPAKSVNIGISDKQATSAAPSAGTETPDSAEKTETAMADEAGEEAPEDSAAAAVSPALDSPHVTESAVIAPLTDDEIKVFMTPRKMGADDAPVKITEYASLSCPHCAHFYKETFPKLKEAYIDTGKVLFTYIDFPLDGAALNAAAVASCMPTDTYFRYIDYLFQTQKDWVFSDQLPNILIQNAKLLGADSDRLIRCIKSDKFKEALAGRMKSEQAAHTIEATPTFLIDGEKIQGALEFQTFKDVIEKKLAEKGKPAQ